MRSSHVLQQVSQTGPHLFTAGQNLSRGQDETVCAGVTKLHSHRVLRFRVLERIVDTVTADLVDSVADGATSESGAVNSLDSSDGALGQASVCGRVWECAGTSVAIWVHPELGV